MNERSKKWLLWGSLVTLLLSIGAMVSDMLFPSITDFFVFLGLIIFILSLFTFTALLSIKYQDRKWFMLLSTVFTYLFPLFIFALYFSINFESEIIGLFAFVVILIFIIIGLINVFIFREAGEIIGILILLLFIVVSFVLMRISVLQGIFPDLGWFLFTLLSVLTGCGMFMFGIRCLFLVEKNSYLKIISFIASVLIAFGSVVFMLKMQSEKTEIIELVYFIPAFLITLTVLFSLPVSGYINWSSLHKRILKKVMITWVFFLLVFSVSFVFPDVFQKIAFKENKPIDKFRMMDYELQNKNGLKPE